MPDASASHRFRPILIALVLFLVWTVCTYLLEGRIQTLLRPDATMDRLLYALVANLVIGIGGAAWLLRRFLHAHILTPARAGFREGRRIAGSVFVALVLGFGLYAVQGPPTWNPIVILNAFAQVLTVSVAEILVCWVVVGSVVEALLHDKGRVIAMGAAIGVASVLFGLYHFAHSPPFDTWGMVGLLMGVGLVTSLFYFVSREVYGTIVFHNTLALFGVVQALASNEALATFARPMLPLLVTGGVTVMLLIVAHVWLVRSPALAI